MGVAVTPGLKITCWDYTTTVIQPHSTLIISKILLQRLQQKLSSNELHEYCSIAHTGHEVMSKQQSYLLTS